MVQTVGELANHLQEIKAQRRDGVLSMEAYYMELLKLCAALIESLIDEAERIDEQDARKQVPLILLFLEEQIRKFDERS